MIFLHKIKSKHLINESAPLEIFYFFKLNFRNESNFLIWVSYLPPFVKDIDILFKSLA